MRVPARTFSGTVPCVSAERSRTTRSSSRSAASSATSKRRARERSSRAVPTTRDASSRTSAAGRRIPEYERIHPRFGPAAIAGELMGSAARAALPRPPAREGGGHDASRRRGTRTSRTTTSTGRQTCSMWMPVDPVAPRVDARVRRRLAPRPVADAAHVHGAEAKWFPEGSLDELAGHRRRSRSVPDPRVGARAGRRRVLPHADAARGGGSRRGAARRRAFSVRFLGDDVTHVPCAVEDVARVPWARRRAAGGRGDEHPLFPVVWERAALSLPPRRCALLAFLLASLAPVCPRAP